jgi:CRP/FNR family transcriptional activator FtrB
MPDFLHVVVEGIVELFASHEGRETTIALVEPVTTFILAAVIRDEVYLKSARSVTPVQILMIPAASVRDVFGRDAVFARAVVNELALRYRTVVRTIKNEKLRPSIERLANWIRETERQQGGRGFVELKFEKRALASLLGTSPENLSRNLAVLAEHGVVSQGRKIMIADRRALAGFARPNSLIDG